MNNNLNPYFTVFTPIFNRIDTIHRVWESLKNQTYKDFEWIIVDDGSTDDIMPLLSFFKNNASFPVVIQTQSNQGKHIAWNNALTLARGVLFVPADADDSFENNTLQFFYDKWIALTVEKRNTLSGINVLCANPDTGMIIGDKYPKDCFFSNSLDIAYKLKLKGEKWGCIRTDLLKGLPYPEIRGRSNYIQSYTWFSLSSNYQLLCFNEVLRNYYRDENSITNVPRNLLLSKRINDAPTWVHFLTWNLNKNGDFIIRNDFYSFIKELLMLINYVHYQKINLISILNKINKFRFKLMFLVIYFPGKIYHHFEKHVKL